MRGGGFSPAPASLLPDFSKPPSQAEQSVRAKNTKEPTLLYLQHAGYLYKLLANIKNGVTTVTFLLSFFTWPGSGTPPLSCHTQKREVQN
jgi:hypothetical protein